MKLRRSVIAVLAAFAAGFVVTGVVVPSVRFLWVAYHHAGF